MQVHGFSDDDRSHLLRLTEQVNAIAMRLGEVDPVSIQVLRGLAASSAADVRESGETLKSSFRGAVVSRRATRPPLPDPRLVRQIIRNRQLRARFFVGDLFADPAWDILLDLTAARAEHKRVSVTSLCIASCVPLTTALRSIGLMIDAGLLERIEDATDRRRAFIGLSDRGADAIARYFAELGSSAAESI